MKICVSNDSVTVIAEKRAVRHADKINATARICIVGTSYQCSSEMDSDFQLVINNPNYMPENEVVTQPHIRNTSIVHHGTGFFEQH